MSYRNLLSALAFVSSIFWFSQGAYADPDWSAFWSGGWGSDQVVGTCSGKGSIEVGGNVADLNIPNATCDFSKPQARLGVPCRVDLTYTLPSAPTFDPQKSGGFQQNWFAACNTAGLQVEGLLHCNPIPAAGTVPAFPEINDALGLDGRNGSTITSNICKTVFGSANSPVFDAQIQFETPNSLGRVVDLSKVSTWKACHADIVNDPTADPNCIDGGDTQKLIGKAEDPVTRAFCSYSQPINSQCQAPDSGIVTMNLFADKPATAEPGIISISLDSVDLNSFMVNGVGPTKDGACKIGKNGGQDVITCRFPSCDANGNFVFFGGTANLTATRKGSQTGIECKNVGIKTN